MPPQQQFQRQFGGGFQQPMQQPMQQFGGGFQRQGGFGGMMGGFGGPAAAQQQAMQRMMGGGFGGQMGQFGGGQQQDLRAMQQASLPQNMRQPQPRQQAPQQFIGQAGGQDPRAMQQAVLPPNMRQRQMNAMPQLARGIGGFRGGFRGQGRGGATAPRFNNLQSALQALGFR